MYRPDQTRMLAEIRQWVELETPTRATGKVNRLADLVETSMREAGLFIERIPGICGFGDILIGRTQMDTEGGLLVSGHLDTVHPAGTLEGPLAWRVEGDKAYGPGIYDMKACCVMALEAWRMLRAERRQPKVPITFLFVPDEEVGSSFSRETTEKEARRSIATYVMEPARDGGKIVIGRKGIAAFKISTYGRAAHAGSRFADGRNAINEMALQIGRINSLIDVEAGVTINVGTIKGGTGRNTVPDFCQIDLDIRAPDAERMAAIVSAIRDLRAQGTDISIEVEGGVTRPPFHPDTGCMALYDHARTVAKTLGIDLEGLVVGGGSDGNFTAGQGCPTLDGLGCDGADAHTLQEHIVVSSLVPRTRLLAELFASTDAGSVGGDWRLAKTTKLEGTG